MQIYKYLYKELLTLYEVYLTSAAQMSLTLRQLALSNLKHISNKISDFKTKFLRCNFQKRKDLKQY